MVSAYGMAGETSNAVRAATDPAAPCSFAVTGTVNANRPSPSCVMTRSLFDVLSSLFVTAANGPVGLNATPPADVKT